METLPEESIAIETINPSSDLKVTDVQRILSGQATLFEILALAAVLIPGALSLFAKLDTEKMRKDVGKVLDIAKVDFLRKQNEIENLLGHLMGVTLCDRVIIGLFTSDKKYLTVPYEVTNIGYATISDEKTRINVENIHADLDLVVDDKFTRIDKANETVSSACRQYLESINLLAVDSRKIISPSGELMGVIQLHYMRVPTDWTSNANAATQVEAIFNRLRYDLSA